ncbi:MAG: hypothetical protein HYU35_02140 [Parcubacteria group bacterium]|nr:hypothetical protein [Parcubacteria group bacterium]
MVINISDKKLKGLIKESVREALEDEVAKLRAFVMPEVSEREQADIEKRYGKPSRKKAEIFCL